MKIIIVEDEKHARDMLEQLLLQIDPQIQILAKLDTVKNTVAWLKAHQVDLIFLDIHLADDLSFKIFEQIEVTTPIIFTTAYDQYALRAFKVNSIDYLLKPIAKEDLASSIEQFKNIHSPSAQIDYQQLISAMEQKKPQYQERFIVSRGDKIMSITIDQVAYFEGEDRYVYLTKKDGARFIIDYKLSDLEKILDVKHFFRLNRSFITHFDSIDRIVNLSKSRVKVELRPMAKRDIIVSSANTRSFKLWLNQ
ncbi:MAG: LytTR family DNA-binding domain-containing protein [Bacteroidota bacterium]